MKLALVSVTAALLVAGCARGSDRPQSLRTAAATPDWRAIATEQDRERLREWRTAWVEAARKVEASGQGIAITREGPLLQPDAAIEWRDPPPGDYHCRVIKMGAQRAGQLNYAAYPAFTCRIRREDGLMSFAKLTGSQRPIGHLLPFAGQQRMVFLGTLQLGDERRSLEYGHDRERDMAGIAERIEEKKWRLVFPYPAFESTIDVLEIVAHNTDR